MLFALEHTGTLRYAHRARNIQNKAVSLDNCQLRIGTSDFYTNAAKTSLTNASFETNFSGQVACVRLWKTNLQEKDILVHKTDFTSTTNRNLKGSPDSALKGHGVCGVWWRGW